MFGLWAYSNTNPKAASDLDIPASADEDHNIPSEHEEAETTSIAPQPRRNTSEEQRPPPPFPQRLKKQIHEYQYKKFFDILKQVLINLPLVVALQQMPNYAKFLKDMVSRKTRIGEFEIAAATEACLAMMHNKVPAKKTDPGSFTIPCSIGNNYSCKALCDPGASINLMPKSVFQQLGIGKAKPTTVMLQLADRSYVQPEGKIKDILVRVDKFIFPADFLILDCEADEHAPIILGRPFLATGKVLLDFENNELVLRVNDQQVKINVFKVMKHPTDIEDCQAIGETTEFDPDSEVTCLGREFLMNLGSTTIEHDTLEKSNQADPETGNWAQHNPGKYFESLNYSNKDYKVDKPSVEQPPNLELKPLPEQLKYAYLGDEKTLPVIISSKLQPEQEEQLIQMLWQHKKALGWTIADIKGISPAICMHKILLEDNHKPIVDAQRRLNQAMKDVVRKEILKWLDAGYNQIAIAPEDQSKTTITFPYGTFAFRRMSFGLCNAPATFQRCMTTIFSDMNEDFLEIFMDDFSTFGDDFTSCLNNLEKVLSRCEETNLVLNWEKCHFMVDEGIVLRHKISCRRMEVDRAKVEVISKLPPPTSVKGIRSFMGHADQVIRRCVPENEQQHVLEQCHASAYGGHFGGNRTAAKVLQSALFWPHLHRDAQNFCQQCDKCQRTGNISKRNEMPLQNILEVELFDVWGVGT
ncbi:hypothetical protein V6N13_001585 [Hibiscus sabdariffa]